MPALAGAGRRSDMRPDCSVVTSAPVDRVEHEHRRSDLLTVIRERGLVQARNFGLGLELDLGNRRPGAQMHGGRGLNSGGREACVGQER